MLMYDFAFVTKHPQLKAHDVTVILVDFSRTLRGWWDFYLS